ncbi:unnamed protein product [Paramecium sonneborni]|uniref:Uncharacterized protein n=1 Tax=Paramecium sonneborni TaxID=65129 RepID=A0A8S1QBT2_9CILI|nr:unnamed protein product [Paramecium sonneborni]
MRTPLLIPNLILKCFSKLYTFPQDNEIFCYFNYQKDSFFIHFQALVKSNKNQYQYQQINCTQHPETPLSLICIPPHKCQRKLCAECQYQHGADMKLINQLIFRAGDQKNIRLQEMNKINFLITYTEITVKKLCEKLSQSIEQIFNQRQQEDEKYIQLLNKNPNFAESSYADLEKLVQILNGKNLNDGNTQLQNFNNQLEQEVQAFTQKIKEQIKEISSISKINQSIFNRNVEDKEIQSFIGIVIISS